MKLRIPYYIHITSHHITSHHITSHHITSHHIISYHLSCHIFIFILEFIIIFIFIFIFTFIFMSYMHIFMSLHIRYHIHVHYILHTLGPSLVITYLTYHKQLLPPFLSYYIIRCYIEHVSMEWISNVVGNTKPLSSLNVRVFHWEAMPTDINFAPIARWKLGHIASRNKPAP